MPDAPAPAMLPAMLEDDRRRAGWSMGQVAWRLGVSVRAYRELEAGERPDPLHVGAAWTTPRCLEFYDLTDRPEPASESAVTCVGAPVEHAASHGDEPPGVCARM